MIELDYKKSNNKLLIKCSEEYIFNTIRKGFSVVDKNKAFIQRRFQSQGVKIPSRKYAITPSGACDIGLYWEVRQYIIKNQLDIDVQISEKLKQALFIGSKADVFTDFALSLRDYQVDVLRKALQLGWGTCVLGTGAGKTLTTAALIENYYRNSNNKITFKCVVIVPDLGLVKQTADEFNNSGVSYTVSTWTGSDTPDLTANVIICNIGILQSRFDRTDWVKYVDLLIVDECHKIGPSNKISKIIAKIKTRHRYGFTGTLPDEPLDKWFIIGRLGPVLYEKTSADLREGSFLTNVEVIKLNIQYPNITIPNVFDSAYRNELDFIINHPKRNELLSKLSHKLKNNTLILVNFIKHGDNLYEYLKNSNIDKQIYFIKGEVEVKDREVIKKLMEDNNNVICIAISAIFSTGVNVKNIHNIIFASGGKSFIRTVQSIGRGLRLHPSKTRLTIVDISDMLIYGEKHGEKRLSIYKREKIPYSEKNIEVS